MFWDGFIRDAERCIVKLFRIACLLNRFRKCAIKPRAEFLYKVEGNRKRKDGICLKHCRYAIELQCSYCKSL